CARAGTPCVGGVAAVCGRSAVPSARSRSVLAAKTAPSRCWNSSSASLPWAKCSRSAAAAASRSASPILRPDAIAIRTSDDPCSAADPKTIYLIWRAGNNQARGGSSHNRAAAGWADRVGVVVVLAQARPGGEDRGADVAELPHLFGCQPIHQRPAYLIDVPWRGGGQHGEALVGQLRDLAAAVGRAVQPLNPAAFLEPGDGVRQPALAVA